MKKNMDSSLSITNEEAVSKEKLHATVAEQKQEEGKVMHLQRAQWLRAAILGASDGLLSTASLMLGIGAATARDDQVSMIISGVAGALAGAFSMATGEFVSVSTQRDIQIVSSSTAKFSPETELSNDVESAASMKGIRGRNHSQALPNPYKAAAASCIAFLCGSLVPVVPAMVVVQNRKRVVAIMVVTSIALSLFGGFGAFLGGSPIRRSAMRVLFGGWISMAITYILLMAFHNLH